MLLRRPEPFARPRREGDAVNWSGHKQEMFCEGGHCPHRDWRKSSLNLRHVEVDAGGGAKVYLLPPSVPHRAACEILPLPASGGSSDPLWDGCGRPKRRKNARRKTGGGRGGKARRAEQGGIEIEIEIELTLQ